MGRHLKCKCSLQLNADYTCKTDSAKLKQSWKENQDFFSMWRTKQLSCKRQQYQTSVVSIWAVEIWVQVNPKLLQAWRKCMPQKPLPAPDIQIFLSLIQLWASRYKVHYARTFSIHHLKYMEDQVFPFCFHFFWVRPEECHLHQQIHIFSPSGGHLLPSFHPATVQWQSTAWACNRACFHHPMKHHKMVAFVSTNRTVFLSQVPAQRKLQVPVEEL